MLQSKLFSAAARVTQATQDEEEEEEEEEEEDDPPRPKSEKLPHFFAPDKKKVRKVREKKHHIF